MLLAEVGIPPGAEVDRASLTVLVNDFKSSVYRYEVQPNRVVFSVWPMWGTGDAAS